MQHGFGGLWSCVCMQPCSEGIELTEILRSFPPDIPCSIIPPCPTFLLLFHKHHSFGFLWLSGFLFLFHRHKQWSGIISEKLRKVPKHLIVYLCFLSNINSIIFQEPEKAVVCEYWFNSGSTVGLESPLTMCIQTDCARRKGRRGGRGGTPNRKTSGQGEPTTGS